MNVLPSAPAPGAWRSLAGRRQLLAAGLCVGLACGLGGCSTIHTLLPFTKEDDTPKVNLADEPPDLLYSNGVDALSRNNYNTAVKHFDAIQQNYPYSSWATSAQLMEGYTEYRRNSYTEAVSQLDRFIALHPASKDVSYVYYLRALCYYEQIADISRDQKGTQEAMAALQEVVNRFPDSAYARDARLKIDLCRDHLAGKEMDIGRYYEKQHLYAAAIGRYQRVIDDFQTTNHTPEALSRLTEIYLKLGMVGEAKKTAAVLAYNYPGSKWYQNSYGELVQVGAVHGTPAAREAASPGFFSRSFGWIF